MEGSSREEDENIGYVGTFLGLGIGDSLFFDFEQVQFSMVLDCGGGINSARVRARLGGRV
jgi:hypothetical protein